MSSDVEQADERDVTKPWCYQVGESRVEVGRFTYGTQHIVIRQWYEGANLTIGSFCSIARGLKIFLGGNHRVDWCTTFPFGHIYNSHLGGRGIKGHPQTNGDVVIGHDVWIAEGVTIYSGVTIGDGAVIAGNASVTRDVGPYEIWGGNPARLIRSRFPAEAVARLHSLEWWDCSVTTIRKLAPILSQPPDEKVLERLEFLVRQERQ